MATAETVILSYHLKNNLWIEEEVSMLMLGDDISVDLDVAMPVRRDGVDGQRTPDGILTRLNSATVGRIITAIESLPAPGVIDFGFLLLAMSGKAITEASTGIDRAAGQARRDGQTHDMSLGSIRPRVASRCTAVPIHYRWRRPGYGVIASFVNIAKKRRLGSESAFTLAISQSGWGSSSIMSGSSRRSSGKEKVAQD